MCFIGHATESEVHHPSIRSFELTNHDYQQAKDPHSGPSMDNVSEPLSRADSQGTVEVPGKRVGGGLMGAAPAPTVLDLSSPESRKAAQRESLEVLQTRLRQL